MRRTLHAEWTKLRTTPGPGWLLVGVIALTVGLSAVATAAVGFPPGSPPTDTTKLALTGVYLGQALVAILAVLVVSGEYSTGMIRTSFTAMPRRLSVLAAKAVIVTGAVLTAGSVAAIGSLMTGRVILPGNGFTAAHGYPLLSLTDTATLRATFGSVLYLGLVALLSLGLAAAVRDSATAIGVSLGLLYLFPIVASVVDPQWQRRLDQVAPMTSGLYIQATTRLHSLPLSPWEGLGVLAAWAAAALVLGGLVVTLRDA
ncbi:MAG: ABC transporter permease [Nocardioidaceae bacterium]